MKKLIVFLVALSLLALPLSGIVLALDGGVDEAGIELSNPTDLVTSPPDAGQAQQGSGGTASGASVDPSTDGDTPISSDGEINTIIPGDDGEYEGTNIPVRTDEKPEIADDSAEAINGSRSQNGVILITESNDTSKAESADKKVTYSDNNPSTGVEGMKIAFIIVGIAFLGLIITSIMVAIMKKNK